VLRSPIETTSNFGHDDGIDRRQAVALRFAADLSGTVVFPYEANASITGALKRVRRRRREVD
jgi:hypothetical protein